MAVDPNTLDVADPVQVAMKIMAMEHRLELIQLTMSTSNESMGLRLSALQQAVDAVGASHQAVSTDVTGFKGGVKAIWLCLALFAGLATYIFNSTITQAARDRDRIEAAAIAGDVRLEKRVDALETSRSALAKERTALEDLK